MYYSIKHYCEDFKQNGLFLLDMPTGHGKTHNVFDYIYNTVTSADNDGRKFIFVTSLNKNLDEEPLKERFVKDGNDTLFEDKFIRLKNTVDSINERFDSDLEKRIPKQIKALDEFIELRDALKLYEQSKKTTFSSGIKMAEQMLRQSESRFRRKIESLLCSEHKGVDARLFAIKTDTNWQWLGELYPVVFTREKQIIFLTVDKFLLPFDTLVEQSGNFYNSSFIDGSVVFVDEFDSAKDVMLNRIIDMELSGKADFIELFNYIYGALITNDLPAALITPSKKRAEGKYKEQSLRREVDTLKESAESLYKEYCLQFSHKTAEDAIDSSRNFLFHDFRYLSVFAGGNSYIRTIPDEKKKQNIISFSKAEPNNDAQNLQVLLGKLRGFLSSFYRLIHILSTNYMQYVNEGREFRSTNRQRGQDEFTRENAIRSVLAEFHFDKKTADYLYGQVLSTYYGKRKEDENGGFDLSFYEKGFRLFSFEDSADFDLQSKIMGLSFQMTPEKILLRVCERAQVVGISATATVPSVLGNFDLSYIKSKLGEGYYEPPMGDKCRMDDSFRLAIKGYDGKVNINVALLGATDDYSCDSWNAVFEDEEFSECAFQKIKDRCNKNDFYAKRYLRCCSAFKEFVLHNDIYSFLALFNTYPVSNKNEFDRDVLLDVFALILKQYNVKGFDIKNSVVILDGTNFDDNKDKVLERLAKGEKIFVISTYQAIGAGQNLHYRIPKGAESNLVKVNDKDSRGKKDFDGLYLDAPTSLLVNLQRGVEDADFAKYLFQAEFLQESWELSKSRVSNIIKRAFSFYRGGSADSDISYDNAMYKTDSYSLWYTRVLIQAVGRICRTNMKAPNIYIFADAEIAKNFNYSVVDGRNLNIEFLALAKALRESNLSKDAVLTADAANQQLLACDRAYRRVMNLIPHKGNNWRAWTEDSVKEYERLGEIVLASPTMAESKNPLFAKNYCVKTPFASNKYYYYQKGDFGDVGVSFNKDSRFPFEVSAEKAKLSVLMDIPHLKDYFIGQGYATRFEENEYIISPVLFNNIYKGRVGERAGWWLFRERLGIELETIKDLEFYEYFDFKIPDSSVFVDFKNWQENADSDSRMDEATLLAEIDRKALRCGCKCVLIVNVVAENKKWMCTRTVMDSGTVIVRIPSLVFGSSCYEGDNIEAWSNIGGCVREFSNKNE